MSPTLAELAVVVVTWHNAADVPPLLASLAPARAAGAELTVVDNASGDDTVALVRTAAPDARVIVNAENHGFAVAANQGFRASARPFVLFLNPDTEVAPDALPRALAYLVAHPSFAVVGCRTLNEDGSPQPTVDRFHSVRGLVIQAVRERRGLAPRPRGAAPEASGPVDGVYGSFLLARRAALDAVAGFDEAYEMYGEDLDLCHRLHGAGFGVGYCAEATVVHRGNRSGAHRYGPGRDVAVLRGTLRFFRRRRGRLAELGFRAAAGAGFACKALLNLLAPGGEISAAKRARRYGAMAWLCLIGDPAGRRADRARLRARGAPGIEGP